METNKETMLKSLFVRLRSMQGILHPICLQSKCVHPSGNNTMLINATNYGTLTLGVLKGYHLYHWSPPQSSVLLNIFRMRSGWVEAWHLLWQQARQYVGLIPAPSFS